MQESPATSLVRLRTVDSRVVGAGFLVGEQWILTCAHVVSQALGLNDYPVDPPQGEVWLDFPLIAPARLSTARVVLWCPPLLDGRGDIAGLELQGEPPAGAEVVRFAEASDVWEHPFRAFGFPAGYDDGVWATGRLLGRQATGWAMIEDVKAQGFAVGPGFSGTPVWDTQVQGVVGMVVAASRPADTKAAFVIPLDNWWRPGRT
jgi:S1-C subfamily serine protease